MEEDQQKEKLDAGEKPADELENLKKERDEYLNGWKRAKADLINYQKDESKRFAEMAAYAKEVILGDLIMILDSFELALMAEGNNEGLERIKSQLEDVLKRHNLEKIKVSKGNEFNPELHESIGEQEDKDTEPGKISAVVSSGYKINNKVIRPVRVKLSK